MRKQGSITVYLCLILTLMLSLILGSMESIRGAHARVMTSCAMEQGLYSLFAQYDRTLLEQYELFFVNGGFEDGIWQPERLCRTVMETASDILSPAPVLGVIGGSPSGGEITERYLTGFILATDQHGKAFSRQICEAMKSSLGTYGIQQLSGKLREEETKIKKFEEGQASYEEEKVMEQYEQSKGLQEGEGQNEGQENRTEGKEAGERGEAVYDPEETGRIDTPEVPENFVNPIEVIREVMQMGILSLVLPEGKEIPMGQAETAGFLSKRELQNGFGFPEEENEEGIVDKLLAAEYALWKFPCYTEQKSDGTLGCQAEYVIGGADNDKENLTSVALRLLAVREAANLVFLMTDQEKRMEMESMSAVIAASLGIPAASGIVKAALAVCWAFAESILDLRELLDGGKVALVKNTSSWQLSLERLPALLERGEECRKSSPGGMEYRDYLRLLLMKRSLSDVTEKVMDLVEYNIRTIPGKEKFHLDYCVDELEAGFAADFGGRSYRIIRSYGYGSGI